MLPFEDQDLWSGISVWDLLKTFIVSVCARSRLSKWFNVYEEVTTKQKLTLMAELFDERERYRSSTSSFDPESPMDVICAFLAILEAVKFSMVTIHQHGSSVSIVIRRKPDFDMSVIEETSMGRRSRSNPSSSQVRNYSDVSNIR